MSLWLIGQKSPCMSYTPWDGVTPATYNSYLVTPPRQYIESIVMIPSFFYVPGNDRLVSFIWFDYYRWPSWKHTRFEWDAGTGEFIKRVDTAIWGSVYTRGACIGSYGRIYSTYINAYDVYDVDWETLAPQELIWTCPSAVALYALMNLEDDLAVTMSSWNAYIWQISTGIRTGNVRLPTSGLQVSWESRRRCWLIGQNSGAVFKLAYAAVPPRMELMSSVQNPSPTALGYRLAFDTKRNRIAVLRWLPDGGEGECNLNLEFYRPIHKVSSVGLTDPVPVTPVREGQSARFIAHLFGDAGEGLGAYYISAGLQAPPAGNIISPSAPTTVSGEASFGYSAPGGSAGEQDTLVLNASLEQDGS
jgi:hypothetical protein